MRTVTPALQAILDSNQYVKCNLFTFTHLSGQVYRWTDADVEVTHADGRLFSHTGPSISGARYQLVRGLQVSSLELQVLAQSDELFAGAPWVVAARSGALDGTVVEIEKAFMAAWGQPAESLSIFKGEVSNASHGEQEVTLTVTSDAVKLNTMVPRLTFQPGCMRTLYAPGCDVSRAAFSVNGSVTDPTGRAAFQTNLTQDDGYFALGTVRFTSGANAGVTRSIKAYANADGRIELSSPLAFDLAANDAFVVVAGCDRTQGMNGCAKFNNLANYKATPYTPKPEAIV